MDLDWRGFELHPETPEGGMDLEELLGPRAEAMSGRLLEFARSFGVTGMLHPQRLPNTRRILAAAEWARSQGRLHPFRRAAMAAHWREEKDLEREQTVREVARVAGVDPDGAWAATRDPQWLAVVDAAREDASAHGITGIPTFRIGDRFIVGCQPYEVLERAVLQAGAARRE